MISRLSEMWVSGAQLAFVSPCEILLILFAPEIWYRFIEFFSFCRNSCIQPAYVEAL